MLEYKKGWYSICLCKKLDVDITEETNLSKSIKDDSYKYIFLKIFDNDAFSRYQVIRKSWILIESYSETTGLTKKKIPVLRRFTFDYYSKEKRIIFHSGILKIESAIEFMKKSTNTEIKILKNVNLTHFLEKLSKLNIRFKLLEGTIINYELKGGTVGNLHFKGITKEDKSDIFSQKDIYLSWIKINVNNENYLSNFIFYSNGTFYQNMENSIIVKLLDIYINLYEKGY